MSAPRRPSSANSISKVIDSGLPAASATRIEDDAEAGRGIQPHHELIRLRMRDPPKDQSPGGAGLGTRVAAQSA